jgi:hypothetical protein
LNLNDDLKNCIARWFSDANINVNLNQSVSDLLERFIYTQSRLIRPMPRKVYISDTLAAKLSANLLDAQKVLVLEEIKRKFERGEDVFHHLPEGILNAHSKDDLLNDWGIHHLHLSNTKCNPQQPLYDRTGHILFLRTETTIAYFIDILLHGRTGEKHVFAKQELIAICKRNWPKMLNPYTLEGMRVAQTLSDEKVEQLRRAGMCTFADVEGQAYFPIGGGLTSARTNISHRILADRIMEHVRELEDRLKELKKKFGGAYPPPQNFDFKLTIDGYRFVIIQYPERKVVKEIPF